MHVRVSIVILRVNIVSSPARRPSPFAPICSLMLVRTTSGLRSFSVRRSTRAALSTASQSRFERAASRERREWRRTCYPIRCFEGFARRFTFVAGGLKWWRRPRAGFVFARRRSTGGAGVLVLLLLGAPRLGRRGGPRRGLLPEHPLVEPSHPGRWYSPSLGRARRRPRSRGAARGARSRRRAECLTHPTASPPSPTVCTRACRRIRVCPSRGSRLVLAPLFHRRQTASLPVALSARPSRSRAPRDAAHREAADEPVRHSSCETSPPWLSSPGDARVRPCTGSPAPLRAHPAAAARGLAGRS